MKSPKDDIHSETLAGVRSPVVICDYVFIGTRAMILPGVIRGGSCRCCRGSRN
jgi:acetyltransferase-like isoleucine patch superfamily enzyme